MERGGGAGVRNSGGGGGGQKREARWGGAIVGGGGQQWGGGVQLLRTAFHTISMSPKQFELKQSWKAQRALNALGANVYPVFDDEKSKASDEKSVKRKIA